MNEVLSQSASELLEVKLLPSKFTFDKILRSFFELLTMTSVNLKAYGLNFINISFESSKILFKTYLMEKGMVALLENKKLILIRPFLFHLEAFVKTKVVCSVLM